MNNNISLPTALMNRNDDMACNLIEQAENLNYRDEFNRSLLHLAYENGCMNAAAMLLSRGANIDACATNIRGEFYTSLHRAVQNEKCSLVSHLLQAGASVRFPQQGQREWITLEVALRPRSTTRTGQLRKKNRRLIKILFSHVFQYESEQSRREILAYLIAYGGESYFRKGAPTRDLVIQYLARFDAGIQHEFFERFSDQSALSVESFYKECVNELSAMKEIVLYENITLYKFFARSGASQVNLMRNKALLDRLKNCEKKDFKEKYPTYKNMLEKLLYEAKRIRACYLNVEGTMKEMFMKSPTLYAIPISEILDRMPKDDIFKMHCDFS